MEIIIVIFFSYISGSIPYGLIITKIFGKEDIRKIGSGNIGATNVLRTGNKFLAVATLALDILKGYIPVIVTTNYYPDFIYLSCMFAFLGHLFPFWLKFRGGKGVATYLGIITALSLQLCFLFIFTWLVLSLIFKYSSLSSMFASLTVFIVNILRETIISTNIFTITKDIPDSKLLFIFFVLIVFTHRKNISNLKDKSEQKIKI